MHTESNKEIARQFFARFTANDLPGVLELISDDVSWWLAGRPPHSKTGGTYDKAKLAELFGALLRRLKGPLRMEVENILAEGDQVAVEVESHGELTNGRIYNNQYHFRMTIRDGKIVAAREYNDTQHSHVTFFER